MKQSAISDALPQSPSAPKPKLTTQKKKLPTAQDLISHYESQGLDSQQASLKAIEDLQNVLIRVVGSGRNKKDKFMVESSRKIDSTNSRLSVLDMKLDSKPGYFETFAIGVVSGAALKGIGTVLPHVFGGLGQAWNAVRTATKPNHPS